MGASLVAQCAPFVVGAAHGSKRKDKMTDYVFHKALGEGAFGKVCAATDCRSAEEVAVKVVRMAGLPRGRRLQAQAEVELWQTVHAHPNIVGLRGSFTDGPCLFIVMERCQRSVASLIRKDYAPLKSRADWYVREMLLGVQACHQAMLAHRDIKPDNFLVGGDGAGVKLCDFGLSAMVPRTRGLRGLTGTVPFMSPEMLSGKEYALGTDIWSFAVTAYTIFFEEFPYVLEKMTTRAAKRAVMEGEPPKRLGGAARACGRAKEAFLLRLLQLEPARRASAVEALEHPFLQAAAPAEGRPDAERKSEDTLAPPEDDDLQDDGDEWSDSATTSATSARQSS